MNDNIFFKKNIDFNSDEKQKAPGAWIFSFFFHAPDDVPCDSSYFWKYMRHDSHIHNDVWNKLRAVYRWRWLEKINEKKKTRKQKLAENSKFQNTVQCVVGRAWSLRMDDNKTSFHRRAILSILKFVFKKAFIKYNIFFFIFFHNLQKKRKKNVSNATRIIYFVKTKLLFIQITINGINSDFSSFTICMTSRSF